MDHTDQLFVQRGRGFGEVKGLEKGGTRAVSGVQAPGEMEGAWAAVKEGRGPGLQLRRLVENSSSLALWKLFLLCFLQAREPKL